MKKPLFQTFGEAFKLFGFIVSGRKTERGWKAILVQNFGSRGNNLVEISN
jgi:hypothetical protein